MPFRNRILPAVHPSSQAAATGSSTTNAQSSWTQTAATDSPDYRRSHSAMSPIPSLITTSWRTSLTSEQQYASPRGVLAFLGRLHPDAPHIEPQIEAAHCFLRFPRWISSVGTR